MFYNFSCVGHLRQDKPASPGQYWIFEDSGRIYNPTAHLCVTISGSQLILKEYFFKYPYHHIVFDRDGRDSTRDGFPSSIVESILYHQIK